MTENAKNHAMFALTDAMRVFPQLRIGQLLMNACPLGRDLYYVTDAELAEALSEYVEEHGQ